MKITNYHQTKFVNNDKNLSIILIDRWITVTKNPSIKHFSINFTVIINDRKLSIIIRW